MSPNVLMTSGRQVGSAQIAAGVGSAAALIAVATLLAPRRNARGQRRLAFPVLDRAEGARAAATADITAARKLNIASATLAFSVLADSAIEHYRAMFFNPAMYMPLLAASASLAVGAHGFGDPRRGRHRVRNTVYVAAAATGLAGTGFHIYNVAVRREGGVNWQNLFYGAPVGAPFALLLSGLLGAVAEEVRDAPRGTPPRVAGLRAGRLMSAVTALGLIGTSAEAGLLHFRGAFHNPFMLVPVTVPPVAAVLLGHAALKPSATNRWLARWWLRITAAAGIVGAGFHAYGVHRNMGGWRNWRQNILNGPPLPAPPSFTGLALAGLAALTLSEDRPDA